VALSRAPSLATLVDSATALMFSAMAALPLAPSVTLRPISAVAAACSSTIEAMLVCSALISPMVLVIWPIESIAWRLSLCTCLTVCVISSVAFAVCCASAFTSLATTANPLPASPARAASMVALSASRLVCAAMVLISLTTSETWLFDFSRLLMLAPAASASLTALDATCAEVEAFLATSWMVALISSALAETVWTFRETCSAAAATLIAFCDDDPADSPRIWVMLMWDSPEGFW
jgi:hypothetical protein